MHRCIGDFYTPGRNARLTTTGTTRKLLPELSVVVSIQPHLE